MYFVGLFCKSSVHVVFQIETWPLSFCANASFQRNLRLIDLSGNKFKSVPFNIYRLRELVTLKVADNPELVRMPSFKD